MREWDGLADQVAAAGAVLYVLSADSPAALAAQASEHGLQSPLVSVSPALWAHWGIQNADRPKLPHPTTLVVAGDGRVLEVESHVDYKRRTDPAGVLARLGAGPEAPPAPAPTPPSAEPDWDHAAVLSAERSPGGARLSLVMAPGFHAYGTSETVGRPLEVRVMGQPDGVVAIPPGHLKTLAGGLGQAWVLDGTVVLEVPGAADQALAGELDLQLCTETSCSRPTTWAWSVE